MSAAQFSMDSDTEQVVGANKPCEAPVRLTAGRTGSPAEL